MRGARRIPSAEALAIEAERLLLMYKRENQLRQKGYLHVAGADEAGRGPLAGPVVAAAVILGRKDDLIIWRGINDSKQLSPGRRETLFQIIMEQAQSVGVGKFDAAAIDRINIHQASLQAMKSALEQLEPAPDFILADGFLIPGLSQPQEAIIKGDSLSLSIAAASIVAKVTRDRLMTEYDRLYPQYGFAQNKGYPTEKHRKAIEIYGLTDIHRKTFRQKPVSSKSVINGQCSLTIES